MLSAKDLMILDVCMNWDLENIPVIFPKLYLHSGSFRVFPEPLPVSSIRTRYLTQLLN